MKCLQCKLLTTGWKMCYSKHNSTILAAISNMQNSRILFDFLRDLSDVYKQTCWLLAENVLFRRYPIITATLVESVSRVWHFFRFVWVAQFQWNLINQDFTRVSNIIAFWPSFAHFFSYTHFLKALWKFSVTKISTSNLYMTPFVWYQIKVLNSTCYIIYAYLSYNS